MSTRNQTIIRCNSCGQVYHVPHSSEERRAKCRPCGNEFLIPVAVEHDDTRRQIFPPRQAAADRYAAARLAASTSQQLNLGGWSYRRKITVAAGLLLLGLFTFVARGFNQEPVVKPTVQPIVDIRRGRIAKLSLPRGKHEYASVTDLIEAVEPSVVQIQTSHGWGSGFVLSESGLIVTCHHVIDEAYFATAIFADGRRLEVVGTAALAPECDVAIVVVDPSTSPAPLVPLVVADEKPKKGQPIVVMGSPLGLSFSQSEGSVSGLRTAGELAKVSGNVYVHRHLAPDVSLVQVAASLMPGNSGGPAVDFSGNVVGIGALLVSYHGQMYEFCIAASEIRQVAESVDGEISPLWTGEMPEPSITRFPGESERP